MSTPKTPAAPGRRPSKHPPHTRRKPRFRPLVAASAFASFAAFLSLTMLASCSGGTIETAAGGAGGEGGGGEVVLDGGGPIPTPPDGEKACPATGSCNYQTNEGCTDQQTCVPGSNNGVILPTCLPAGTGVSGATCQSVDQCAPGYLCAGGQCRKLCCGGDWSGCPSVNEHCIQGISVDDGNGGGITTGAMLCLLVNECDPLVPSSCAISGTTCQIVDPSGASACFPEGTGDSGQPCPCKGGFLCVDNGGNKECHRLCKAVEGGGQPSCKPGEGICIHYNRDPPGVGECTPKN